MEAGDPRAPARGRGRGEGPEVRIGGKAEPVEVDHPVADRDALDPGRGEALGQEARVALDGDESLGGRHDLQDVDDERLARRGALDVDGPRGRRRRVPLPLGREGIGDPRDVALAAEGVLDLDEELLARLDPERRRVRRVEVEDGVLGRQPLHGRVPRAASPRAPPARGPLPRPSARSFPRATSRGSGAMPQLVHGWRRRPARARRRAGSCRRPPRASRAIGWPRRSPPPGRPCRRGAEAARAARASRAFEGDLADPAPRQERERPLVLPPLAAERCLPVDVGLDPVAVADVDGGLARDALDRPLERRDAPLLDLAQVGDVERRLVELDRVDPERRQLARLGVEGGRERRRRAAPGPRSARPTPCRRWSSAPAAST